MDKRHLREVLVDQKEVFQNKSGIIKRDLPLDNYLNTSQIVVITGVRRCGKSSLLFLIKNELGLSLSDYCYCNFDDERITFYPDLLNDIYTLHLEMYRNEPVFFFDEIQEIPGWEKFVNRMYEQGRKVFITGSNATMLSSEISSSLTGRNRALELFPFSFSEYLRMEGKAYQPERLSVKQRSLLLSDLSAYMETGGFPLVVKEKDTEIAHALFQDILYRDIAVRYKLSNIGEVRQIALYLATNSTKLFSYATLQTISGLKSLSSVKNYLQYFEASYLFYYLKKFDYSLKKQIMNSRKVFAVDTAIPNRLGFRFSENKGRLLENVVFVELKRRGCELYYFSGKFECDFLVKENLLITEAIQVTYTLNADNFSREMGGLREAMQSFKIPKGTLIVFDDNKYPVGLTEGVSVIPAHEWLLNNINH